MSLESVEAVTRGVGISIFESYVKVDEELHRCSTNGQYPYKIHEIKACSATKIVSFIMDYGEGWKGSQRVRVRDA